VAAVSVKPPVFALVFFDADKIAAIASDVADRLGFAPGAEIRIEVDEAMPLGRTTIASLDPPTITVEGGAFEDAKHPRQMSEVAVRDVLGRLLMRVKDRLDPAFGEPPGEGSLSLRQQVAWTAYSEGRCERLGLPAQKSRWLYHFRNRHGFTDAADSAFERLWESNDLTWAEIDTLSEGAAAATGHAEAATS
jgi:hypothetical protein